MTRLTTVRLLVPLLLSAAFVHYTEAQVSGGPSANCHIVDGQFTACPNGTTEWSDVQPITFQASDSFLYVNQDPAHMFLYLMYDLPVRTSPLGPTDSVHVNFNTVETESDVPTLVVYDVYISGNGQMQVLQQGQPTPAGTIVGAIGFGASPNSTTPHVIAELQVPLSPGLPPSTYSSDPLFWKASIPPSSPPSNACIVEPGKDFSNCTKEDAAFAADTLRDQAAATLREAENCTAETLGVCVEEEIAMVGAAAVFAAIAYELYVQIVGDPAGLVFTIEPDANFTVIAQPATYSISLPESGVPAQEAAALNAIVANSEQVIAIEQAAITSIARQEGASAAGNSTWVANQMQAAQNYSSQMGPLLGAWPGLSANLAAAFQAAGAEFTFNANDIQNLLNEINPSSPPSEIQGEFAMAQTILTQLGLTAGDQSNILQLLLTVDPQAVATLGTGAFPQSLADPALGTALQQLATALAPAGTTYNLVGVTLADGGTITGHFDYNDVAGSYTYTNVDLTVTGAGAEAGLQATITSPDALNMGGLCFVEPNVSQGACSSPSQPSLIFIFQQRLTPNSLTPTSPGLSSDQICIGNTSCFGNAESEYTFSNGTSVPITAGSVVATPVGTPLTTVTAAVVQADANGDTVANLRGLAPTDAPTLPDQIAMIVQYRTIQNPSISGPALTNQLVTGLVNDGVISSGDASTIESAVVQNLVTPVGVPSLSGHIISQSVVSPGLVQVILQLTNIGSGASTNTQINQLALKTLTGGGQVTIDSQSPPLPDAVANLAVSASTTVTLFFDVPSTVKRFSLTETGLIDDMLGRQYAFSISQLVFE